jgi:phage terminase large subunit-like protein
VGRHSAETVIVEPPVDRWNLSCPDWRERLKDGRSLVPDLPLNLERGNQAVAVFNKLRLADVPGTPTMAEAGGDWFRDIVRALFGALDERTRQRMIRELFLLVPKKNSKTTNGALLMLTALLLNERPHASLIMTAPVQDVAQLAFDAARGAIALDPVLERKLHVRDHIKTIVHRETKAELEIMTFDPSVMTGQKPVYSLIDELHVISKMSKASSALRQLRGGMHPFPEGFLAFITTQSEEPPSGVFKEELTKAREIRDGKRQGAMLPVLYEFPDEMQLAPDKPWRNPENWRLVTPNAGRSISIPRLIEDMEDAESKGEGELRAWASQHLNVEIGIALRHDRWVGADYWQQCGDATVTLEEMLKRCDVVTFGIDGGGLDDLLGAAAIGREEGTGRWLHWAHAWAHEIVLQRRKAEADRFLQFKKEGDLTIVDHIGDDVDELADIVDRIEKADLLDNIGVDPAGIGDVLDALALKKIDEKRIIGIPQGWKLVGTIKTTERKLAGKEMVHGARPMMAWSVSNAKVEPRGNAIIITKQISGSAKIDPLMATFNAVALMSMNPKPRKKKYQMFFVG